MKCNCDHCSHYLREYGREFPRLLHFECPPFESSPETVPLTEFSGRALEPAFKHCDLWDAGSIDGFRTPENDVEQRVGGAKNQGIASLFADGQLNDARLRLTAQRMVINPGLSAFRAALTGRVKVVSRSSGFERRLKLRDCQWHGERTYHVEASRVLIKDVRADSIKAFANALHRKLAALMADSAISPAERSASVAPSTPHRRQLGLSTGERRPPTA